MFYFFELYHTKIDRLLPQLGKQEAFLWKWRTYAFRLFVLNFSHCQSLNVFFFTRCYHWNEIGIQVEVCTHILHNNSFILLLFQWWSYEVTKEFGITEVKTRAISSDYSTFPGRLSVSLAESLTFDGVALSLAVSDDACSESIAKGNAFANWCGRTWLSYPSKPFDCN
jgi:hypothetical protein